MVRYQAPTEWQQWVDWLAAGLHGRNRWRLSLVIMGIVFASGRRAVTTWLRAVGIHDDFADYYYFLQPVGRKAKDLGERLFVVLLVRLKIGSRLLLAVDDSPTKRYGPKVQSAGIHHNPTPGPVDQKFLYGHIWEGRRRRKAGSQHFEGRKAGTQHFEGPKVLCPARSKCDIPRGRLDPLKQRVTAAARLRRSKTIRGTIPEETHTRDTQISRYANYPFGRTRLTMVPTCSSTPPTTDHVALIAMCI